ncbi:class 1 fructose-bisphosphatase [Campylobacter corcagiensis]|uniref:Fructose-1,6-bisphosphatase class 1 n=1 Tax=Campylobacter corcagiensis TaxID=1448857 RepID=A0A7M1LEA6_9BACT|nr:class 1 fructose-bisphosphatase [Campylobacter corcagiensis]QKF64955.1 fructose-1,6-bisphosphatase I [Campylobacter corcagiensis]QOQ86888.1 class 1 fructose-bisphosphatase [Campylobacter corcagiensis]
MNEILKAIKESSIKISELLKDADFGYTSHTNHTGDTQLKLDVRSDELITEIFSGVKSVKALISEEKDEALSLNEDADFIVAYDPLDGSSLVDVNFAVGSIFGIYKNKVSAKNLVASAYAVYGPRLELVICGDKPILYRYKNGEFVAVKELKLNEKGKLNATGASQWGWSKEHRKFIKSLFDEKYRLRYSGAMVADLHQILLKGGGLFSYPATTDAPNGKLRVTFEVLPFAYIYEKAGGATTDGKNSSLLELEVKQIHATTPCYFGSKYEISKLLGEKCE